jgi:multidrug efflux system outer membrane protein
MTSGVTPLKHTSLLEVTASLSLIISVVLLTSCSVGPSYDPPCIEIPSEWKNEITCGDCDDNQELVYLDFWWQVFDDDKLDELESLAIENNRDLYVAYERIQEYRALMGVAASAFYPQINLNPQYTNTGELVKNYINPNNTALNALSSGNNVFRAHELLYFLPANLSYEVDLWGKIRDQYHFAEYNWLAQKKNYEVVMLSLTSSLATAYYQLRAIDAQIDLLLEVIKTREKAYEINKSRYEEQITFYADVTLAAEEINSVVIQYEEVLRQRDLIEDQIAVLIGVPASEFCLAHMPLTDLPPCIPGGIPSEVLLRRPDIAEAEYITRADHALVKAAYAQFFPSLTLTSTGGFESPIFKDFLRWLSRYWSFGAQANQLIFDGFKTPYYLDAQIARFKEAGGEYQQQVLIAFQEVEDALADLDSYSKQYEASVATEEWAQKTYQLYSDRYTLGVIYYIDVANTERDLLNYQIDVNTLRGLRYVSTIQFIKALGGGW